VVAAGGTGNALSFARIQSLYFHGGEAMGKRLQSPETLRTALVPQCQSLDLVLGEEIAADLAFHWPAPG